MKVGMRRRSVEQLEMWRRGAEQSRSGVEDFESVCFLRYRIHFGQNQLATAIRACLVLERSTACGCLLPMFCEHERERPGRC
eukprot:2003866-Rhodomonas_salina.1